jgi:signal transduction histidine kinase
MEEVRRFSRALRPIYLEEAGLVAALEALTRDAGQDGTETTFEVRGDVQRLAPEVELALYRIVQEALHNVARHAQASAVRVGAEFQDGVMISVQDDGVGFAVPQRVDTLAEAGHFGLMGMHERAQLVGAHLAVRSRPGKGTTIEVHWRPAAPAGRTERS